PSVFVWEPVWQRLGAASAQRIRGEALLFGPGPSKHKDAEAAFVEAFKGYLAAETDIEGLQEARRVLDRAWMILPAYAPYLEKRVTDEPGNELEALQGRWLQAVNAAIDLDRDLTPPTNGTGTESPGAKPAALVDFAGRKDRLKSRTDQMKDYLA